ncbi:IclR family transcriptional regulator [Flavimaribacter sediminis]|nr:IclR family transcriptional regulator [Flavimaribacter sediminis]
MAVLDVLASDRRGMRLAEIANAMKLSRPTAYQRLLTLIEAGWVELDDAGRYRLSLHACRISAAALEQASLGQRVVPIMERLVEETHETASISVLDGGVPCIIQRVESENVLRAEQKIGTTMSLEGSASGRILVAYADDLTLERLSNGTRELPPQDVLAEVREKGYAISTGYTMVGVRAVAAPVFDYLGKCPATVSLVAPDSRFHLDKLLDPLLRTAGEITQLLKGKQD